MNKSNLIQKIFKDMDTAAALRLEADRLDFQARKNLADVYRGDSASADQGESVQNALSKRIERAFKKN